MVRYVGEALNSQPDVALKDALASDRLAEQLKTEVTYAREISEVTVTDANNVILTDSIKDRRGEREASDVKVSKLEPLVKQTGWLEKAEI